jgi:hypothetical protein
MAYFGTQNGSREIIARTGAEVTKSVEATVQSWGDNNIAIVTGDGLNRRDFLGGYVIVLCTPDI